MPVELPFNSSPETLKAALDEQLNTTPNLVTAQQTVAENFGFLTWPQLDSYINKPDAFENLVCLNYDWRDHPRRREQAHQMLQDQPDLASQNIHTASAAGNVKLVEQFLDDDPDLLNQRGGISDWEPLMYACYARPIGPTHSTSDVIELLIERGANPNAFYRWGGIYHFSALTGLFGGGEQGPLNQPEHPVFLELSKLLLDAGANPNDGQALYNRMFGSDDVALQMLIDYGLNKDHHCNWYATVDNQLVPNPEKTLDYQLQWAVKNNLPNRVELLLAHGADATQRLPGDGLLTTIARRKGFNDIANALERHGGEPYELETIRAVLSALFE